MSTPRKRIRIHRPVARGAFGLLSVLTLAVTALAQTPPNSAPPPKKSPLQTLAVESPNATKWVLAPLEQDVPPDIRQNLTFLKEDIADEAKAKPIGTISAYQAAYRLCTELINAFDERDLARVRAGYRTAQINNTPLVTSQALEARRNYQMSWPQYAREQNQRAAIEKEQTGNANVAKEGIKLQWAEQTVTLRRAFDQLYSQFRTELRATPALLTAISEAAETGSAAPAAPPRPPTPAVAPPPPTLTTPTPPTTVERTPAAPANNGGHHAELRNQLEKIVLLNHKKNTVLQGSDWNSLTPEDLQLVNGIKIGEMGFPDRGFTYFKVYVVIDNQSPDAVVDGPLTADARILSADPSGKLLVDQTSEVIGLPNRGRFQIALCNTPYTDTLKRRNGGDPHPKNVYVAFRINDKIFREVLLSNFGPENWWTNDELLAPRE